MAFRREIRGRITTFTGVGRDKGITFATTKPNATARFTSFVEAKGIKPEFISSSIPTTEPLRTGEYFEQAEKAEARQVGISQSKPVLIPIKNVRGQIVGVRDTKSRQSISVTPGSITQRQLDISEGITDISRTIKLKRLADIKAGKPTSFIETRFDPLDVKKAKARTKESFVDKISLRKAKKGLQESKIRALEKQFEEGKGISSKESMIAKAKLVAIGVGEGVVGLIPSKQFIKDIALFANTNPIYSKEKIAALQRVKNKGFESWEGITGLPTEVKENLGGVFGQLIVILGTIYLLKGIASKRAVATKVTLAEESFIKSLPRNLRAAGRKLLKSPSVRKIINPSNLKKLNVNTIRLKSLTKFEINALKKTLNKADSITLGAKATRMTNFNMVTADINQFNRQFMKSLPTKLRRNYKLVGKNIIRKATNKPIFEIKPISQMKIASKFRLKPGAAKKLSRATKPLKKAFKPIRKVGKIVRIGGERLSKANTNTINSISNKLNAIGIDVRLVKSIARNKIKTITSGQIKSINEIIRRAKLRLRVARINIKVRTQIAASVFRRINRILKKANIKLKKATKESIKKTKERVGEVKAIKKTKRFVTDIQNKLNVATFNTNQRIKFTKLSVKKSFKKLSEGVKRDLTRELNSYKSQFRTLLRGTERKYDGFGKLILETNKRNKLSLMTKRFVARINKKLKKFNYKIEIRIVNVVSATKRVVRIRIRGTERFFSGTGKKILEVERRTKLRQTLSKVKISRLTKKISSINKKFGLNIKISKFKLKQKVRIAKFPIDRAINRKLTQLNNYLTKSKGKITAPVKRIANEINKMIPFEIVKPKIVIIKGFKIPIRASKLDISIRNIVRQLKIADKIRDGKSIKVLRTDFAMLEGKKVYPFFDKKIKSVRFFKSRKKWLKAIKQQEVTKSKGLIRTAKEFREGVKKSKLKSFFKNERQVKQVLHDKVLTPKVTKKGVQVVDDKGRTLVKFEGKTYVETRVGEGQVQLMEVLQKTKQRVKVVQKSVTKQRQVLVQKVKQAQRVGAKTSSIQLQNQIQKLALLVGMLTKQNQNIGQLQGVAIAQTQADSTKQSQKVKQAVKQAQKAVQKAAQGIRQAQKVQQKIIPKLLQEIVKITTKKLPIPPLSFDIKKLKQLKKLTKKELKKDKFIYIPDLYSRIYGIYANPKEKRMLLRKGVVFSGIDIRKRI